MSTFIFCTVCAVLMYFATDVNKPPVTLSWHTSLLLMFVSLFTIYNWQFILAILLVGHAIPWIIWSIKHFVVEDEAFKQREAERIRKEQLGIKTYSTALCTTKWEREQVMKRMLADAAKNSEEIEDAESALSENKVSENKD